MGCNTLFVARKLERVPMTPAASHAPIPDHGDGHYLKSEFNALLRRRDDVNKFLIEAVLDGVW